MSVYSVDILKVLKKEKTWITPNELARKANLRLEQVNTILPRLVAANAIEIIEDINEYIFLTSEGKEYLEKGLPEIILIKFINNKKKILTKDLKKADIENFAKSIGMNWAKKKKLIEFIKENSR